MASLEKSLNKKGQEKERRRGRTRRVQLCRSCHYSLYFAQTPLYDGRESALRGTSKFCTQQSSCIFPAQPLVPLPLPRIDNKTRQIPRLLAVSPSNPSPFGKSLWGRSRSTPSTTSPIASILAPSSTNSLCTPARQTAHELLNMASFFFTARLPDPMVQFRRPHRGPLTYCAACLSLIGRLRFDNIE